MFLNNIFNISEIAAWQGFQVHTGVKFVKRVAPIHCIVRADFHTVVLLTYCASATASAGEILGLRVAMNVRNYFVNLIRFSCIKKSQDHIIDKNIRSNVPEIINYQLSIC